MNLNELRSRPHLSASSIMEYMECGLSYRFRKVDHLPQEGISSNLIYGTCIHAALESFYHSRQNGHRLSLPELQELFHVRWKEETTRDDIRYKKGTDQQTLLAEALELLRVFHEEHASKGFRVLGIEVPFSFTIPGVEVPIIGAMDLIEQDSQGNIVIVDHKTTARAYSKTDIDSSLQLTLYWMAAHEQGFDADEILLRFDCLIKTKKPRFESYYTSRTELDKQRAIRKIQTVWDAIQRGVFVPNDLSWKCPSCAFRSHCDEWFTQSNSIETKSVA